jgi:TPR repeat protein
LAVSTLVLAAAASAGSFDESHPDQYFRNRAAQAAADGRWSAAIDDFRRAARYADKPSQLALAFAYWNGEGVAADRATGYVWADLAAERGVPAFLAVREQMWSKLSEDERALALVRGAKLAEEYADVAAMPRMENRLRQGRRQKTGSRTGSTVYATGVSSMDSSARAAVAADIYSSMLANVGPTGRKAGNDSTRDAALGAADGVTVKPDNYSVYGGSYGPNMMRLLGNAFMAASRHNAMGYYDPENWDPRLYFKAQDAPWRDLPVGAVLIGPLRQEPRG